MRPIYLILCPQCLFFLFVSKPISLLLWNALPQNSATLRVKPIGSCHSNQRVILPANSISTFSNSFLLFLFSTNTCPPAKWLKFNSIQSIFHYILNQQLTFTFWFALFNFLQVICLNWFCKEFEKFGKGQEVGMCLRCMRQVAASKYWKLKTSTPLWQLCPDTTLRRQVFLRITCQICYNHLCQICNKLSFFFFENFSQTLFFGK